MFLQKEGNFMNNEKIESIKKNIQNALEDYWKHSNRAIEIKDDISEVFINRLAEDSYYNKFALRKMLRKSPAWNEELDAIVINGSTTHEPNYNRIKNLGNRILAKPLDLADEEHFNDIYNSILFFATPNTEAFAEEKKTYLESLNRVAPNAYVPGKKLSRVFKALCVALGVADNTAGSSFEQNFAKIADEMSSKKIHYKLFLSVNPAHFITMSNPKSDDRGECLTSCHSFNNIDYDYNNGCIGYARDAVTMIAFTASDPDNPETLNNRKTTRQLFMYEPNNGLLLQSRMYNTSGGTHGAQAESAVYRDLVQREIARCEDAVNLWKTYDYYDNEKNITISADENFGGYADWDYEEFNPKISIRKDSYFNYHEFTVGKAGLCIMCGEETTINNGLYCDNCIDKRSGNHYICHDCDNPADHLNTVYDCDGEEIEVCDYCLENHYGYCEVCNSYHPIDDMHWIEGEEISVCDNCYDDEFDTCAECGLPYRKNDMYDAIDANEDDCLICEHCKDYYYVECEDCGKLVHENISNFVHKDGYEAYVCPDCLDDNYEKCKECEEYYNDTTEAYDEEGNSCHVCENCLDQYYKKCEECDEYYHEDFTTIVHDKYGDEKVVCDNCCCRNYEQCEKCEEYYPKDTLKNGYCPDCLEDIPKCDCCNKPDKHLIIAEHLHTEKTQEICQYCLKENSYNYKQVS